MPDSPNYEPNPQERDPMGNSQRRQIKADMKGNVKECPYCVNAFPLKLANITCLFMPSLNSDPTDYVYKGSDGECPDCGRFIRLKDLKEPHP